MLCRMFGVIIKKEEKFLVVKKRAKKIEGWVMPAFHFHRALQYEYLVKGDYHFLQDKLRACFNIHIVNIKQIDWILIKDYYCKQCRNEKLYYPHCWNIYEILTYRGEVKNLETNKYRELSFKSEEVIKKLLAAKQFDYIWQDILIKYFNNFNNQEY